MAASRARPAMSSAHQIVFLIVILLGGRNAPLQ
jgi:hypothetical protein